MFCFFNDIAFPNQGMLFHPAEAGIMACFETLQRTSQLDNLNNMLCNLNEVTSVLSFALSFILSPLTYSARRIAPPDKCPCESV